MFSDGSSTQFLRIGDKIALQIVDLDLLRKTIKDILST